jgi:hypothetical protein
MSRTNLSAVVSRQLPEHIREDYPTFVAFVEAYYEYLKSQGVDFSTIRDIDNTLESFIIHFKKELAHNLPNIAQDERFLLQNIKDHYLAKGSEASYKLLFRLLFDKEVDIVYPGRSILIPSDGRWNQEISVFAQVDYGDADDVIGKLVDIETGGRVLRVLIDKKEQLIGEVDRIVKIGKSYELPVTATSGSISLLVSSIADIEVNQLVTGTNIPPGTKVVRTQGSSVIISKPTIGAVNDVITFSNELYEFFLDKRFFGIINPGDMIKFQDQFQATIVPATQSLRITQKGKNFRIGQVFELRSGRGTGSLMKITAVEADGGIKNAEFIKFGIGYSANFALSVLATNDVISSTTLSINPAGTSSLTQSNTYQANGTGLVTASPDSTDILGGGTDFGLTGGVLVGDEIWTTDNEFIGVVKSIDSTTSLEIESLPSENSSGITAPYFGSYVFRNNRGVGVLFTPDGEQSFIYQPSIVDRTEGFNEQGYINRGDYVTNEYVDGTYAGSIITEFSLNFRNAQVAAADPAIISIGLGALVKYPGFFETNNGFLSDSIFVQDSRYYQAFSYVIKIDERLSSYKSAVKTMLHPSGMALFGEFQITNNYDLSLQLESLVKSLGIGIEDEFNVLETERYFTVTKGFSHAIQTPLDSTVIRFDKSLEDSYSVASTAVSSFTKALNQTTINYDGDVEGNSVVLQSTSTVKTAGKNITTNYGGMSDVITAKSFGKLLEDLPNITDALSFSHDKYLYTEENPDILPPQDHQGYVQMNSYYGQDYVRFEDEYSVGSRESTFNTL